MKVLSLSSDPGGTQALSSVISLLRKQGIDVNVYAYKQGMKILKDHGLCPKSLSENTDGSRAKKLLHEIGPDICIFGTSMNGVDLEKMFIQKCRELSVPSLSVLDFWSNYSARYTIEDSEKLDAMPDIIAVMDSVAAEDMIAEGFPQEILRITGQPAFDKLFKNFDRDAVRGKTRKALGIKEGTKLVTFASQPLSKAYLLGGHSYGYNEIEVLDLLWQALGLWEQTTHKKAKLWIRPHPREGEDKFTDWKNQGAIVCSKFNKHEAVAAADLVTGMNSIFLLEACLLGGNVLSLQPGLIQPDPLPFKRLNLGYTCYHKSKVPEAISSALNNSNKHQKTIDNLNSQYTGGTENLVSEIKNLYESTRKQSVRFPKKISTE